MPTTTDLQINADELRQKLLQYRLTARQKWRIARLVPWSMLLQITIVFVVGFQVIAFGTWQLSHIEFMANSEKALRNFYLLDWPWNDDIFSGDDYAIYSKDTFYKHVGYAVQQYPLTKSTTIGPFDFKGSQAGYITMTKTYYRDLEIDPSQSTYVMDTADIETRHLIIPYGQKIDIKDYLEENNFIINFNRIINIKLDFDVTAIHLHNWGLAQHVSPDSLDCFHFNVQILYNNEKDNGKLIVSLDIIDSKPLTCTKKNGTLVADNSNHGNRKPSIDHQNLGSIATLSSVFGTLLCITSIVRKAFTLHSTLKLKRETIQYFKQQHIRYSWRDIRMFLNLWDVQVVLSDCLVIIGSIIICILQLSKSSHLDWVYDLGSIFIGTGFLLAALAIIEHLEFASKNCNIVVHTLQKAIYPHILSFLSCVFMLYIGFLFCGWLVLGPYLEKFRTIAIASQAIFSLINGDDMFATFEQMYNAPVAIQWFAQLYIYLFSTIFIIVVVNVCIAILQDSYEEVKRYIAHGECFPKTKIDLFLEGQDMNNIPEEDEENEDEDDLTRNLKVEPSYFYRKILKHLKCCRLKEYKNINTDGTSYNV